MKECRFCAREIRDTAIVCHHCGRATRGRFDLATCLIVAVGVALGFVAVGVVHALISAPLPWYGWWE